MTIDVNDSSIYVFMKYRSCLQGFATSHPDLNAPSLQILLLVEEVARKTNVSYVSKADLLRLSGEWYGTVHCSLDRLIEGGYIKRRGGRSAPSDNPHFKGQFIKASYCLTGKGNALVVAFNVKYTEVMGKPIPVSFGSGWPRGQKRQGKRGKKLTDYE